LARFAVGASASASLAVDAVGAKNDAIDLDDDAGTDDGTDDRVAPISSSRDGERQDRERLNE
jgi:hypothetical protein